MIFNSPPQYVDRLPASTAAEIEAEPMLYRASMGFAIAASGPVTRSFLKVLMTQAKALRCDLDTDTIVIDSRAHMLMRGHYPCIPGWHHDDVPRGWARDQPEYDAPRYCSRHLCAVVDASDAPTGAMPEFAHAAVEVPWPLDEQVTVYAAWDAHISATFPGVGRPMKDRQVLAFDCDTFHRGMPAVRTGWRFFIRASWQTEVKPENKIRKNANVYVPWSTAGW
jgi:hypothetical protein